MQIKKLKQLDGIKNGMYEIRYDNNNKELTVWNIRYNAPMQLIENLDDLKLYGFHDIQLLQKADVEVIEQIADENHISPSYSRGQWYYRQDGRLNSLQSILNEYGYYV